MHADGDEKSRAARQCHRSPKTPGGATKPNAVEEQQSDCGGGAPERGPIMGDERDKPPVDRQEVACAQAQVLQILRDEDACHADEQNRGSADDEPGARGQQKPSPKTEPRSPGWTRRNDISETMCGTFQNESPSHCETTCVKRQQRQSRQ